jgi:hypothetical protein
MSVTHEKTAKLKLGAKLKIFDFDRIGKLEKRRKWFH